MKPKLAICNAFSLNMLSTTSTVIMVKEVSVEQARKLIEMTRDTFEIISAVGHESTAKLLTNILGIEVHARRVEIKITPETILLVFQLTTRLPEGKTLNEEEVKKLFEEGKAKFFIVYEATSLASAVSPAGITECKVGAKSFLIREILEKVGI